MHDGAALAGNVLSSLDCNIKSEQQWRLLQTEKPFILICTDGVSAYTMSFRLSYLSQVWMSRRIKQIAHVFMSFSGVGKTMHARLIQPGDSTDRCRDVASTKQH